MPMVTSTSNAYFLWICDRVLPGGYDRSEYKQLMRTLATTEYIYGTTFDESRSLDGIDLRARFAYETGDNVLYICGPCSLLEMMASLAIRVEEDVMTDFVNDRTYIWFGEMLESLGVADQTDDRFDAIFVDERISGFLYGTYERNGRGGLFTTTNPDIDMRELDIWYQACVVMNEKLDREVEL
jgi:hypothetical protein